MLAIRVYTLLCAFLRVLTFANLRNYYKSIAMQASLQFSPLKLIFLFIIYVDKLEEGVVINIIMKKLEKIHVPKILTSNQSK